MNRLQYLLTKLAEEASEVAQIALKTQQFGLDEIYPANGYSNRDRCHQELDDFNGIIKMLNDEFNFNYFVNDYRVAVKADKVDKYYEYSRDLGMIND